ncbi:MAG: hypothetical protein ACJ8IK_15855 [Burkholderiaceae bacterium]|jgi:hypothetical protein
MADALTSTQLEILRRVRDGSELTAAPFISGMINELGFLRAFKLIVFRNMFDCELTTLGRNYLADVERQASVEPEPEA